jgi:hypothetical protein
MRVPLLSAAAALFALCALPAAAHGSGENRDDTVRECPLHAAAHYHHRVGRHWAHTTVRCQAPVEDEHIVRVEHEEHYGYIGDDRDRESHEGRREHEHGDGDWREHEHGDRDREEHEWRGADGDRDMHEDHGRAYVGESVHHEEYGDRYGGMHHEDEGRRSSDDRDFADRDGGMHHEDGDSRWRGVYRQESEAWSSSEHGEHWREHWGDHCGCGPARPSATDEDGFLVWSGKVEREERSDSDHWEVHP